MFQKVEKELKLFRIGNAAVRQISRRSSKPSDRFAVRVAWELGKYDLTSL